MAGSVNTRGWTLAIPGPLNALALLPRSIWVPIGAITLLIGGVFWANESAVSAVRNQGERIAALLNFQSKVLEFRNVVVDAESGQRGYLLTNNAEYLDPYRESIEKVARVLAEMHSASAASPELAHLVTGMEILQTRKLTELGTTIALASRGDRPDALAIVRRNAGRLLMEQFRDSADRILGLIAARIEAARNAQSRNLSLSRYGGFVMAILALLMLLLVVRLFLSQALRQAAGRLDAERHRGELQTLVEARTQELFELSTYLQSVQERERADLARNLHDELGGLLTAAKMDLAWLQGKTANASPETQSKLTDIACLLDSAMDLKRRVIESLRPTLLEHFGLATALVAYYEDACTKAGLGFHSKVDDTIGEVPENIALGVFRVAQEALTNVLRHAEAKTVWLELSCNQVQYQLVIRDDGVGIDLTRKAGSHGIAGMQHRVHSRRGELRIEGRPGRGTTIRASFPRASGASPRSGV